MRIPVGTTVVKFKYLSDQLAGIRSLRTRDPDPDETTQPIILLVSGRIFVNLKQIFGSGSEKNTRFPDPSTSASVNTGIFMGAVSSVLLTFYRGFKLGLSHRLSPPHNHHFSEGF